MDEVVIALKYEEADVFYTELAKVRLNGKYGFIDKTGKEVIPLKYNYIGGFNDGLALVKSEGKCGFINSSGTEVIPITYDDAHEF